MLKKIAKAGALFFAVGVALAVVAPLLAAALGPGLLGEAAVAQAAATPVLWTGAFFGTFGAISTALTPVFDRVFGKDEPASPAAAATPTAHAHGVTQDIAMAQETSRSFSHREALVQREQSAETHRSV